VEVVVLQRLLVVAIAAHALCHCGLHARVAPEGLCRLWQAPHWFSMRSSL